MVLVDRLLDPDAPRTTPMTQWPSLWYEMHRLWAGQVLDEMVGAVRVADAARLAEALRRWCAEAVGWRSGQGQRLDWRRLFPRQEFTLEGVILPSGERAIYIDGPLVGVRRPAGRGLELSDCRGEKSADAKDDLLDLAIERRVFSVARPDLSPVFVLDYFLPERETVVMSGDELEAVAVERLDPVLGQLAALASPQVESGPDLR